MGINVPAAHPYPKISRVPSRGQSTRPIFDFRRWEHDRVTGDSYSPYVTRIVNIKKGHNFFLICLFVVWGIPRLCHLYYPISSRMPSDRYLFPTKSNLFELNQSNRTTRTQSNSSISLISRKILWQFDFVRLPNLIKPTHVIKFD